MITRGQNFEQIPLSIVGSSTFGRYPKISNSRTYNMFMSDNFTVPYAGYQKAQLLQLLGSSGRAIFTSTKLNKLVVVVDANVYLINIFFDQNQEQTIDSSVVQIGTLQTVSGVVYITENNKPQILISDGVALYLYDPAVPSFSSPAITFVPGYITFHDTYFICAAQQDNFYTPAATNTWRLSGQNDGSTWANDAASIGLIQTKPDNCQAVVRFPSHGNMILVLGSVVSEPWYDVGNALFPYQRSSSYTIDYGCVSPATIAYMDEIVVWLAQNEQSGPIIMYTTGGMPEKITTDGIDYLFSQLKNPADSQAFLYRQDGHLFYHINFYTDNLSLYYDFNTQKFYNACDEHLNYFIAGKVAFFNNQYYFVTKNNGNLYAFDTIYTTFDGAEIPRFRICNNIRKPNQEPFIVNDIGFTIESGETEFVTETLNGVVTYETPRVDFSFSTDGGATFGTEVAYNLPALGQRQNKLMWWQCGESNDFVPQFKFWGFGRFVATDGYVNIRH